jgi:hypothetical protein
VSRAPSSLAGGSSSNLSEPLLDAAGSASAAPFAGDSAEDADSAEGGEEGTVPCEVRPARYCSPRHGHALHSNPRFLSQTASYDEASNV